MMRIPFNRPFLAGPELEYIQSALQSGRTGGNGPFTHNCQEWLEDRIGCRKALLTHSCTAALEMASLLVGIGPGDEVLMPSYSFVATATSVVLRGGIPVFVDIRQDTLNLDESKLEEAITPRTRAILYVHYAGVACNVEAISAIAEKYGLWVIEDAAHSLLAAFQGKALGSFGHLAAVSFHETKNVSAGEGGALLVNDSRFEERAKIIWEKGTNRAEFLRGDTDKYSWVDIGSSYLPSEITAALLWGQLQKADGITARRLDIWNHYHESFAEAERAGLVQRPVVPAGCRHNAHIYYLLAQDLRHRNFLMQKLRDAGIQSTFHYVPLHSSLGGKKYGRANGQLIGTEEVSQRILRLPLWVQLAEQAHEVTEQVVCGLQEWEAAKAP